MQRNRAEQRALHLEQRLGMVIDALKRCKAGAIDALVDAALPKHGMKNRIVRLLDVNKDQVHALVATDGGTHSLG